MAKSASTPSSSGDIVEGFPSPLVYLTEVFMNLEDIIAEAVEPAVMNEIDRIREDLPRREPRYSELVDDFTIAYDPRTFTFNYKVKGASAIEAEQLEYGPPAKSLLRHEVMQAEKTLGKAISENYDRLLGKGVGR